MMTVLAVVAVIMALASLGAIWQMKREEQRRSEARVTSLAAAIDPADDQMLPFSGPMTTRQVHPLIKVGLGFGVVAVAIVTVALAGELLSRRGPTAPRDPALALLSMSHSRQPDSLTVTGLVQNQSGQQATGVTAEVVVLDRAGSSVATARAPIDEQALRPGMSSSFSVLVPGISSIERYRVSFRSSAGIVRHVDRRAPRVTSESDGGRAQLGPRAVTPASQTALHPAGF